MTEGCSLLLLAGGNSRRMGQDKAWLSAGEVTMIEHLVRRLTPVVDELIVSVREPSSRFAGLPIVVDRSPGLGPLAGMEAGFRVARKPLVWVLACDLPDVEPALGRLLCGEAAGFDAVVPWVDEEPEGVCAVYRRTLASRVAEGLRQGERSVRRLLETVNVRYLRAEAIRAIDPQLRSFRNLNTPAEYEAWIKAR